jgi:SWIM zinc finger
MLQTIRREMMRWFAERQTRSLEVTTALAPGANRLIADSMTRARRYRVFRADENTYELVSETGTNIVKVDERRCTCQTWQELGLPCSHAAAAILNRRDAVHKYAAHYYTTVSYRLTYADSIEPIYMDDVMQQLEQQSGAVTTDSSSDSDTDAPIPGTNCLPPLTRRPPGRPKKKRVRTEDFGREKRIFRCTRCQKPDHSARTCREPI